MAKALEAFTFQDRAPAFTQKYPWGDWTDGRIWQVTRGEDFTIPAETFRVGVYQAARARNLKVKTNRKGDVVTFQFFRKDESKKPIRRKRAGGR